MNSAPWTGVVLSPLKRRCHNAFVFFPPVGERERGCHLMVRMHSSGTAVLGGGWGKGSGGQERERCVCVCYVFERVCKLPECVSSCVCGLALCMCICFTPWVHICVCLPLHLCPFHLTQHYLATKSIQNSHVFFFFLEMEILYKMLTLEFVSISMSIDKA